MNRRTKALNFWRVFRQKKAAVFGVSVVIIFLLAVIFAPIVAPFQPRDIVGMPFEPPSWKHLLGTNDIGADVLSELIFAGRISMTIGLTAALIIIVIGSTIGLLSGYFGNVTDEVLMRFTDIVLALPRLPFMIVVAAYIGPGTLTIILVYSCVGWATLARQVRSQVLTVKQATFIEAARSIGAANTQIIFSHILPNVGNIIIANGVMEIMFAILTEAGLSFLGLGDPIHESWGVMLYFAQTRGAFLLGAWWLIFPAGIAITLLSCSLNFIGTALNDMFGLKLKKR